MKDEIFHGGNNIQLARTLQWLLAPAAMTEIIEKVEKQMASVKLTFTSQEEKDRIIKYCIWFGGRRHHANNFIEISPETLCSTCCHCGYITLQCPNVDRLKCQLCAGPHTTRNHKCEVMRCPVRGGRRCRHTIAKCSNCRDTHYATSPICLTCKQAIVHG